MVLFLLTSKPGQARRERTRTRRGDENKRALATKTKKAKATEDSRDEESNDKRVKAKGGKQDGADGRVHGGSPQVSEGLSFGTGDNYGPPTNQELRLKSLLFPPNGKQAPRVLVQGILTSKEVRKERTMV